MRNLALASVTALILIPAGIGSGNAQQQALDPRIDVKGVTRKIIAEEVLAGYLTELNGKYKMTVAEFTIAPGGYFGPHHHAGPGFRCVTAGEVTNIEPDKTTVIKAGQCFWEAGDKTHTPRNNGDTPVRGLVIELLPASFAANSLLPVPEHDAH
jgi:quercetin dioxygenase-like cupin family protein